MFFLDDFNGYSSEYENGAFKISIHSNWITVASKEPYLNVKTHHNYELVFSRKGVLLHSFHTDRNERFKRIYGYDKKGRIFTVSKLVSDTNHLTEVTEFTYNVEGRIKNETYRGLSFNDKNEPDDHVIQLHHTYYDNEEEILRTENEIDTPDHTYYYTYDEKQLLIEEKVVRHNRDQDLVSWYLCEYNSNGKLIKKTSLNSDGEEDGFYEYILDASETTVGMVYHPATNRLKEALWRHEYVYTNNERGHWINYTFIRDGAPSSVTERAITYY